MKALAYRLVLTTTILASGFSTAFADSLFTATPVIDFKGSVAAATSEGSKAIYPGSEVVLSGERFAPDQQVTIWAGTTQLTTEPLKADAEGKFSWTMTIPDDAVSGQHPLVVQAENPPAAAVFTVKVAPKVEISGGDKFEVTSESLVRGLYQSAYSAKNDVLFVTSAVGRPPVKESALLKLDPATFEIKAQITPEEAPARADGREGGVYAVYGVGVDDSKDTVWVTNTRQNTVAVYNQSDLSLVKQFEPDAVNHARDVVIDEEHNRAYVSAVFTPTVVVIDTETLEVIKTIEIASGKRGGTFSTTSLALDEESHRLFTVSLSTDELAVINLDSEEVEKVIPVEGALASIGVAYDPATKRAFVASQGSDTLTIVDVESGETLKNVPVGAGALSVAFDTESNLAYVSNRDAGTVTVVSPDGEIVANLEGGTLPNHVTTDGKGNVIAINKSRGMEDPSGDRISRIVPKG